VCAGRGMGLDAGAHVCVWGGFVHVRACVVEGHCFVNSVRLFGVEPQVLALSGSAHLDRIPHEGSWAHSILISCI
jgi:hypothetical protein